MEYSSSAVVPPRAAASRSRVLLVAAAAFLFWISLYLYVPTLPTYVNGKSDNLALVGTILAMYGLIQAIIRLPLGIAADATGKRKPFVAAGLIFGAAGAYLLATAQGSSGLLAGRTFTGVAAAAWVPLIVIFSSLFPPAEAVRATSLLTLIGSVGRLLATSVTGTLNDMGGFELAFYLAAGMAAIAILFVLAVPEPRRPRMVRSPAAIGRLVTRQDVLLPSALNAVMQYVVYSTTFGFLPILAQQYGASNVQQSLLVSFQIGTVILGNLFNSAVAKRVGNRPLLLLSLVAMSAGPALLAAGGSLPFVFAAQFCIGAAYGIGYPVYMGMSIQNVDDSERTTAMGLHQAVYAIGMFAGPWLSGIVADAVGLKPMFGTMAGGALVAGGLLTWALNRADPRAARREG